MCCQSFIIYHLQPLTPACLILSHNTYNMESDTVFLFKHLYLLSCNPRTYNMESDTVFFFKHLYLLSCNSRSWFTFYRSNPTLKWYQIFPLLYSRLPLHPYHDDDAMFESATLSYIWSFSLAAAPGVFLFLLCGCSSSYVPHHFIFIINICYF